AHSDDLFGTRFPGVIFRCGITGEFTALASVYSQTALDVPTNPDAENFGVIKTDENAVQIGGAFSITSTVDVASTGNIENAILPQIQVPFEPIPRETAALQIGVGRACDWRANWGVHMMDLQTTRICFVHRLADFGLRIGANYDASSAWTRCPTFEPPHDSS